MADDHQTWRIPPNVQELAAAGEQEPPSRFVVREQDRPASAGTAPIPVVDLSRLWTSSSASAEETAKLRSALQDWGLFLAVGHGMEDLLGEVMKLTREFFKLPLEEKQKYSNLVGHNKEFRVEGYGGDMVVSEDQVLDWCDRFYLFVEPESSSLVTPWPTNPPAFRDVLGEYTTRSREVANRLLRDIAKHVNLPEGYFADMLDEKAVTYCRLNHCPSYPSAEHVVGLKPHSDGSMITIILTDETVCGLQVSRDGTWYDLPVVKDSLLVIVGDTVEILSNGLLKSAVHRVVTNAATDRVAVAMYYTLDPEKEIEPAPELVDDKNPRRYRKTKNKEYIPEIFETLARGKRAIDTVKI